ncbi:unnamed protein product [marine sediment metagenome]|uniref:Uncharacterized protein n=1 Tax=marine sediment metagenome TaxID=412755 RepID=X1I5H1_9ZZZZ
MNGKLESAKEVMAQAALIVLGKGDTVARKLDEKELVSFEELLRANMIQVDALSQLLIEKGLITEQEFYTKLKQVQADYLKQPHSQ